jgi:DNA-binding protein
VPVVVDRLWVLAVDRRRVTHWLLAVLTYLHQSLREVKTIPHGVRRISKTLFVNEIRMSSKPSSGLLRTNKLTLQLSF